MTTQIAITDQYLDGNSPERFNHALWLDRLEAAYRATALAHYPQATVTVSIDRQRNASGYCRPAEVVVKEDGDWVYDPALAAAIDREWSALFDQIGDADELYVDT